MFNYENAYDYGVYENRKVSFSPE